MELQKSELIQRLNDISALYANTVSIRSKMDKFTPEDHYERKVPLLAFPGEYKTEKERDMLLKAIDHREDNAVAQMEAAYKRIYKPSKPNAPQIESFKEPEATSDEKEQTSKYGCLATAGIVIGVVFGLAVISNLSIVGELGIGPFMPMLAMAAIGVLLFRFGKNKKQKIKEEQQKRKDDALTAYNRQKATSLEEYKVKTQAYEEATEVYMGNLRQFLEDYLQWRETFLQRVQEEIDITQKLEEDRKNGIQKIFEEEYLPAEKTLNEANNLVTEEYLPVLDIIIDLLRSGRADDLKEAINLYEDIVYRERQLELEREKEEQRRWEEEQRRRDEERHHKEQMKFQQDQERQRQREEERRQQDAERRHREEMNQRDRQERDRQNEERRRADEERRRAERAELDRRQKEDRDTRDQCNRCAQVGHCSMAFRRANCASFRPR